ncbi:related to beta-N-acetylglucosaminidase [Phialocephala subalpina]|uniref:Related to beta-N-acetylglucosaminidase n=1 Tax=Phialocephala subalpina TaxID=576137 RepID=A0A1L7X4Q1_9HELO|nr:related to beta-N-acetylglucosaminidase [Phialocephala subalpina]
MSTQPAIVDDDENGMVLDTEPLLERSDEPRRPTSFATARLATVLRDSSEWLSHVRLLRETDVIILLTPVVIPISRDPNDNSDPFEPLGRSLSRRHARIRHVPYTHRNGITSTHLGFIKRGHAVILCLASEPLQPEFADVTFAVSDDKPVIVVCCSPSDTQQALPFPAVIHTAGYSPSALEATAALLFTEQSQPNVDYLPDSSGTHDLQPKVWTVEDFNEARDIPSVLNIWLECLGARFAMDHQGLANVLRKPGYSKHYVVRNPSAGDSVGFCATYLSYVDREGERLVASLAMLIVHPTSRLQGIGLSLHSHAITQLKRTRGIIRLQLGSTFPRILYGPPSELPLSDEWFRRRGWQMNKEIPGQGQAVHDLILDFGDWQYRSALGSAIATKYRSCTQDDMAKVLDLVEKISAIDEKLGWFDQYWSLSNGPNVKDIVLAIEDHDIIGTALTYTPACGSQVSNNLPWPRRIGNDVGGVTCISIYPAKRHMIMSGLLNICVETLQMQGMKRMFLDGVADRLEDLTKLGFQKWAQYRDVWKSV